MILQGDVLDRLRTIPDESIQCCVTSPPYWRLRDYDVAPTKWPSVTFRPVAGLQAVTIPEMECCYGLEESIWPYIGHTVLIMRELRRVLREDGTLFLNSGDMYITSPGARPVRRQYPENGQYREMRQSIKKSSPGLKMKDQVAMSFLLAYALQADGWWWRDTIIWRKPNPSPSSAPGRTTPSHEYIFQLAKSGNNYIDMEAIAEKSKSGRTGPPSKHWDMGIGAHGDIHRNPMPPIGGKRAPGKNNNDTYSGITPEFKETSRSRSVWTVASPGFDYELCAECKKIYSSKVFRKLTPIDMDGNVITVQLKDFDGDMTRLCQCGSTEWLSHFATFPGEIAKRCLISGTSAKGCCGDCGKPWVRIVDVKYKNDTTSSGRPAKQRNKGARKNKLVYNMPERTRRTTSQVGWEPGCDCAAGVVPCEVLDIFGGSGTVAVEAKKLNLNWTLIELNSDNVLLAKYLTAQPQETLRLC